MLNKNTIFFVDNPDAEKYVEIDVLSTEYVGMDIIYLVFTFIIYFIMLFVVEMMHSKWAIGKYEKNNYELNYINDDEVKKEILRANESE